MYNNQKWIQQNIQLKSLIIKKKILKRDNYTCKNCHKAKNDDVDVYQFNTSYNKNFITLYKGCYLTLVNSMKQQDRIVKNEVVSDKNKKDIKMPKIRFIN